MRLLPLSKMTPPQISEEIEEFVLVTLRRLQDLAASGIAPPSVKHMFLRDTLGHFGSQTSGGLRRGLARPPVPKSRGDGGQQETPRKKSPIVIAPPAFGGVKKGDAPRPLSLPPLPFLRGCLPLLTAKSMPPLAIGVSAGPHLKRAAADQLEPPEGGAKKPRHEANLGVPEAPSSGPVPMSRHPIIAMGPRAHRMGPPFPFPFPFPPPALQGKGPSGGPRPMPPLFPPRLPFFPLAMGAPLRAAISPSSAPRPPMGPHRANGRDGDIAVMGPVGPFSRPPWKEEQSASFESAGTNNGIISAGPVAGMGDGGGESGRVGMAVSSE